MTRVKGEPAREHIRNALMLLQNSGEVDTDDEDVTYFDDDDLDAIEERLKYALDEIEKGNP